MNDTQAPVANCPNNVVAVSASGVCGANVSFSVPAATDNCGASSVAAPASGSLFNVGVNTVTVTATDGAGNTATCSFSVTVNDTQAPSITNCPANITTCTATATWAPPTATDNCGTPTLISTHTPGATFNSGITTVVYTAIDASGNTTTCSFTVNSSQLALNITPSDYNGFGVSCNGGSNGSATVTPLGGATPYSYVWSNGQSGNNTISGLTSGNYSVTVTDGNNCSAVVSVILSQPTPLNCSATVTNVTCNGSNNGSINSNPTGGIMPYTYTWNGPGGPYGNNASISGLAAGTYSVTTTDANGCSCASTLTVTEPEAVPPFAGTVNESNPGGIVPTLYESSIILFSGGTAPYSYNWSTSGYVQYAVLSTGQVQVLYATGSVWSVTITAANTCGNNVLVFSSAGNGGGTNPLAITSSSITSDNGTGNGAISITIAGGNPCAGNSYYTSWQGPNGWTADGFNVVSLSNLPTGWYVVYVTDCGPDGMFNTGDEQQLIEWFWLPKQHRGRGKAAIWTADNLKVFPNPFSTATQIAFTLPETAEANVIVYDLTGREVATLFGGTASGGETVELQFDAQILPAGIYLCRLTVAEWGVSVQKEILLVK